MACYDTCVRNENLSHMEQYYSMSMKCQAWIKEKPRDQFEAVSSVV